MNDRAYINSQTLQKDLVGLVPRRILIMAEQPHEAQAAPSPKGPAWLQEPTLVGGIDFTINVNLGEGVEPTPEFREALEKFMETVLSTEMTSELRPPTCKSFEDCRVFSCDLSTCHPLVKQPCFTLISCRIG
jgi:hypothetical protein